MGNSGARRRHRGLCSLPSVSAGERVAVRSRGAMAVVEGRRPRLRVHDGRPVLVRDPTGHNFSAGISGGIAYVLRRRRRALRRALQHRAGLASTPSPPDEER